MTVERERAPDTTPCERLEASWPRFCRARMDSRMTGSVDERAAATVTVPFPVRSGVGAENETVPSAADTRQQSLTQPQAVKLLGQRAQPRQLRPKLKNITTQERNGH